MTANFWARFTGVYCPFVDFMLWHVNSNALLIIFRDWGAIGLQNCSYALHSNSLSGASIVSDFFLRLAISFSRQWLWKVVVLIWIKFNIGVNFSWCYIFSWSGKYFCSLVLQKISPACSKTYNFSRLFYFPYKPLVVLAPFVAKTLLLPLDFPMYAGQISNIYHRIARLTALIYMLVRKFV